MKTYNGTFLTLLVETSSGNYKPLAQAKSHTVSMSRTAVDTSTKASGLSTSKEYSRYSLTASVDQLISWNTGLVNLATLRQWMLAGTKVKLLSALLDFETDGIAPLDETAEIAVQDTGDSGVIDEDTTEVAADGGQFMTTGVLPEAEPTLIYFQAVITAVEESSSDAEPAAVTASFESDGDYQILDPATAVTFSPGSIANNVLWLDASIDVTEVTGVSLWEDQSIVGNDASNAVGSTQPPLVSNDPQFNNMDSIDPDGTDDYLALDSALALTDFSIILVLRQVGYYIGNSASSVHYHDHSSTSETLRISTVLSFAGFSADTGQHCIEFHRTGSSINCFKDGAASTSNPQTLATTTNFNTLWRRTTSYGTGKLAAIYVYSSEISSGDLSNLRTYISTRFGITFS